MIPFTLASIPVPLSWKNQPMRVEVESDNSLTISTGAVTDWFIDPGMNTVINNAPVALFVPPDEILVFSAKVTVHFVDTFDAGVLFVYESDDVWAKLCFEYSPQKKAGVVSVVTRGASDDCNSVPIEGNTIYLRVYRYKNALAFHYSQNGNIWHFVRYFTLGLLSNPHIGFSVQSPMGQGCTAHFSEISYQVREIPDLRNGA